MPVPTRWWKSRCSLHEEALRLQRAAHRNRLQSQPNVETRQMYQLHLSSNGHQLRPIVHQGPGLQSLERDEEMKKNMRGYIDNGTESATACEESALVIGWGDRFEGKGARSC